MWRMPPAMGAAQPPRLGAAAQRPPRLASMVPPPDRLSWNVDGLASGGGGGGAAQRRTLLPSPAGQLPARDAGARALRGAAEWKAR